MTGQPSGWWGQILFRGQAPAPPTGAGASTEPPDFAIKFIRQVAERYKLADRSTVLRKMCVLCFLAIDVRAAFTALCCYHAAYIVVTMCLRFLSK